jgi:hypothetical protein
MPFHPDATRRFDELGNGLLGQVVSRGPALPVQPQFRPNIHPVAKLTENDIVGKVEVATSIMNFVGDEIGRLFQRGNERFGLINGAYKALSKLAGQMQATQALRDTATAGFISDTIFDWVRANHGKKIVEPLSEVVLRKVNEVIEDYEIWIPIHGLRIEAPFSMGDAVFHTIAPGILDVWFASAPARSPEEAASLEIFRSRERSRLQGYAAVVVKVRAERKKAVEFARVTAGRATAFLRFFSLVNWTPKLRSYCVPLGSENLGTTAELFLENGYIVSYARGALDDRDPTWVLEKSPTWEVPALLAQLSRLSRKDTNSAFQQTLFDALLLYSRSSLAADPSDKLVYICAALESVLLRNDTEPITKSLGERMAFLVGKDLPSRKAILGNVSDTYALRSKFVHHGNSVGDLETLSQFMLNAWTCLCELILRHDRVLDKAQLIGELEDRKMV